MVADTTAHRMITGAQRQREQAREVLQWVCTEYGVSAATLRGRGRDPMIVEARRVVVGLLSVLGLYPDTVAALLHRDRSTVTHHRVCVGLQKRWPTHGGSTEPTHEEAVMLARGVAWLREKGFKPRGVPACWFEAPREQKKVVW